MAWAANGLEVVFLQKDEPLITDLRSVLSYRIRYEYCKPLPPILRRIDDVHGDVRLSFWQ